MNNITEFIRNTVKGHLSESRILNEYITNQEIYFRDYLTQSREQKQGWLPHEYYYFFDDFVIEDDIEFEMPRETVKSNYADEPYEEVDMFEETNSLEWIDWIEQHNKELYDEFAEYLYSKIMYFDLPIAHSEYPAWSYFDDNPTLVKNQWLIHFTDDADGIADNGFVYGVDDMTKLGLTTHMGEFDKKYGGYNFAYTIGEFERYASKGSQYKYGSEAVIFQASGIKVWHSSDEEPQVIFYGNTAKNIIPIKEGETERWGISNKYGEFVYENHDLEKVVLWLAKNFRQYQKNLK